MGKSRSKPFWAIARNSHVALFTCLIASSLLCQTMHALFLITVPNPTSTHLWGNEVTWADICSRAGAT